MQDIAALISSLGFPIVTAVVLFKIVMIMFDKYTTDIKDIMATHKTEIDEVTKSINRNTVVIQKLIDKLDNIEDQEAE